MNINERKFKKWWLWLIVFLLIAAATFFTIDYFFDDEDGASFSSAPLVKKECNGKYIDTHAHWDNEGYPEVLSERMAENSVGCSILFTKVAPDGKDNNLEQLEEDLNPYIEKFIPFFHIDPKAASDIKVEKIQKANEIKPGYFSGFGEIAFYREPFMQAELTDENWQPVLQYLGYNDLWLMFHLRGKSQIPKLEETLAKYPNNKFLLHGPELYKELPDILRRHRNLYFTLDTASLIQLPDKGPGQILMYPEGVNRSGFQKFDEEKEAILDSAVEKWKPVVLAAPDKVMWGTDVSLDWHADPEVYRKLLSFSDQFVAELPEPVQKLYMYENAARLFLNTRTIAK